MASILDANPVGNDEIADWIELFIIYSGQKGFSTQKLADEAKEILNLEENKFVMAMNTLLKRSQLTSNYPFKVDEISVVCRDNYIDSPYTTLLFLSRPANLMTWQTSTPSEEELDIFETLVCDSLKNYLGSGAEAIPFGWPSKFGRPENFNDAVKWIAKKIGIGTGDLYRSPRRKDGGVDIVTWRKFPDNRAGFQICLVQCTLQQNYVAKSRDIDLRLWSGWLDLDRDPMTILAIPKAVPGDEQWSEATASSIVFERLRLAQFHNNVLDAGVKAFNEKVLQKIRN